MAHVARLVRDVGLAEEVAQDALVAALEHWPEEGLPDKPGAWLMTTAKHRALDRLRQDALHARKHEELGQDLAARQAHVAPDFVAALAEASEDDIGDDLLRLVFTACHPVLPTDARVALTLWLIGGLTTDEIARAFLVPEKTIAQRIVRAKRTLAEAQVPFEVPRADALVPRLGRIVAALMKDEPEAHGLVALMEIQASRTPARADAQGRAVLLMDQDRSRWDALLAPSPVVELNRAVAVGRAAGPEAGLAIVDTLARDAALAHYHWLPSVRGDLLAQLGRGDEARAEFERAAAMTRNAPEQALLLARAQAVAAAPAPAVHGPPVGPPP